MKKKIISLILVFVIIAAVGCNNKDDIQNPPKIHDDYKGIHEETVVETDKYILYNGNTDYVIVIPEDASPIVSLAGEELQSIFLEATNIKLNILNDNDTSITPQTKMFSVGKTKFLQSEGITVDPELLGREGLRLITKGNNIFMFGAGEYGTLFAVYEFLNRILNFEQFFIDTYSLNTNVREIKLFNYNITDVPDIDVRIRYYGYQNSNIEMARRMRLILGFVDSLIPVNGNTIHNSFDWLNPDTYGEEHPLWFASEQLCYTAHGNAEEFQAMIEEATEVAKETLIKEPIKDTNIITFTMQDSTHYCGCTTCKKEKEKYGTNNAVIVKFINLLYRSINEWMNTEEGLPYKRDLNLIFFAYFDTAAPVKLNENNEYVAIDESVICDKGVGVFYAPIFQDYKQSIYDTVNKSFHDDLIKWSAICEDLFLWYYCNNFMDHLVPYDDFNSMQDLYAFSAAVGVKYLMNQAVSSGLPSGWHALKGYLQAKLAWNVNCNMTELTENYFKAAYGAGWESMYSFYNSFRVHSIENMKINNPETKYIGQFSVHHEPLQKVYWPLPVLKQWMSYIDNALAEIDFIKNRDAKKYQTLYDNITLERVSVSYMMLKLYKTSIPSDEFLKLKNELLADIERLGVTKGTGSIADL